MTTFETGKSYGNDLTIKVISRTAKTITIETTAWGVCRVKVRNFNLNCESIHFKAWVIEATEEFNFEEAQRISFEKAYN